MSVIGKRLIVNGADYEDIDIFAVSTYNVSVSVQNGTYIGDTTITEGETATVTLSASQGYNLPNDVTVTNASYTYDSQTGIIVLSNPTDNVAIEAVCISDMPLIPSQLVPGFWTSSSFSTNIRLCNQVLTKGIQTVTVKSGYVIRAVYAYTQPFVTNSDETLGNNSLVPYYAVTGGAEAKTSTDRTTYTTQNVNYWYGFTFAKTDTTADISPSEDIIDSWVYDALSVAVRITGGTFAGDTTISAGGTATVTLSAQSEYILPSNITVTNANYTYDLQTGIVQLSNATSSVVIVAECNVSLPPNIVQGYWSTNTASLTNRVCNEILCKGIQTVIVKDGYRIRAVYAYTKKFVFGEGTTATNSLEPYWAVPNGMEAKTSTDRTTYTTQNANYWYGFTFAKADATQNILPSEDIIDSWVYGGAV